MNPEVDFYFSKAKNWRAEMAALRIIVLDCLLTEELKWGVPCYTFEKKNVVLIHAFKEYCAVLFVKGALLQDSEGVLMAQTEHTQAARQIRFRSVQEIIELEIILKAYILQAIEVEKAGLKIDFKEKAALVFPEELHKKFEEVPALKAAFEALTPGRQRGYNLYFADAKQPKTRESRIEKCMPQIFNGKGLND